MSDRKFLFGLIASLVWFSVVTGLLFVDLEDTLEMKPNEWGDFLAGLTAPLAFLWLILGYLQQGDELRISNEALLIQAKELQNSVEQQRALVEVTREQVQAERDALKEEIRTRRNAAKPIFAITRTQSLFSDNQRQFGFSVTNVGSTVRNVCARLSDRVGDNEDLFQTPVFSSADTRRFTLKLAAPLPDREILLLVTYTDALDRDGVTKFKMTETGSPGARHVQFEAVDV